MFRAQQNAFDDAVGRQPFRSFLVKVQQLIYLIAKATDENLTSENWEYILVLSRDGRPSVAPKTKAE